MPKRKPPTPERLQSAAAILGARGGSVSGPRTGKMCTPAQLAARKANAAKARETLEGLETLPPAVVKARRKNAAKARKGRAAKRKADKKAAKDRNRATVEKLRNASAQGLELMAQIEAHRTSTPEATGTHDANRERLARLQRIRRVRP